MNKVSETELGSSEEYQSFRSSVALRKFDLGSSANPKTWAYFDCGPRHTKKCRSPIIFIPSISGTADIYYLQALGLSTRGYRIILVQWPPYWSISAWCDGFKEFLSRLELEKVHIFGTSLGGFLAQKFTEHTNSCPRVASLMLCNSFTDASIFDFGEHSSLFWLIPYSCLKDLILYGFQTDTDDQRIHQASDFMIERLEGLSHTDLASRLFLNCLPTHVSPQKVNDIPITIIDAWDESALCHRIKEDLYKYYPEARLAHLKTGGNFPFLSRSDEVNLHIILHLRNYDNPA
uniref:Maspardin n=1 Tax=Lepeophtheirus salmonis TaxID=72036 RepID=C1BVJ0_LEPSM|nr:Maspardin [Lepeophtheirus salmonis]